ncbi:MAG: hypothetical protein ACOH5I_11810 [Oligoflexus sp.]
MSRLIFFTGFIFLQMACVSLSGGKDDRPPEIKADMPLEQAFDHAIQYGGSTLEDVKRLVKAREAWPQLEELSKRYISKNMRSASPSMLLNAVHLYRLSTPRLDPLLLTQLFAIKEPFHQRIAWQLAALKPSLQVASVLENELSKMIASDDIDQALLPEMARAVQANQIRTVYTILRQGLFASGSDDFAKAMIALNPEIAADDFIEYLAQASLEDLRQINQTGVNMYTCLVILRFFMNHPLPVANPHIGHLYYYAISRNPALAEMARDVLEQHVLQHREQMVFVLARQPMAVQMAFVEGTRHYPGANVQLMLTGLKELTAFQEVEEEISSLSRY